MAKTKQFMILLIVVSIIAILILNPDLIPGSITGGFTVLSVSNIDMVSSLPTFNGQGFVVNFLDNGGLSQYVSGNTLEADVTKNAINASLQSDGSTSRVSKGFDFRLTNSSYQCNYPVAINSSLGQPFAEWVKQDYTDYSVLPLSSTQMQSKCSTMNSAPLEYWGKYPEFFNYVCIFKKQDTSKIGALPSVGNFTATSVFRFAVEGESPVVSTISNSSSDSWPRQIGIGDKAYVQMTGFQASGAGGCTAIAGSTGAYAFYRPTLNQWVLIPNQRYNEYTQAVQSLKDYAIANATSFNRQSLDNFVLQANVKRQDAYNNKITSKISDITGTSYPLLNNGDASSAIIQWQSERFLYPQFVLYVKASSLQIHTLAPNVEILSASSIAGHKSGTPGQTAISLKNNGDSGNVDLAVTCDTGSAPTGPISSTYIAAGQTTTIPVAISTSCSTTQTHTCTVKAIVAGIQTGTKTFTDSCLVSGVECTPNQYYCAQGNIVQRCKADGSYWDNIKTCSSTQTCDVAAPGQCRDNAPSWLCGDNVCTAAIGETSVTCPTDCPVAPCNGTDCPVPPVIPCEPGYHMVTKTTTPPWWNFWDHPIQTNTCEPDINWNLLALGGIIVATIIVVLFAGGKKKTKKRGK